MAGVGVASRLMRGTLKGREEPAPAAAPTKTRVFGFEICAG